MGYKMWWCGFDSIEMMLLTMGNKVVITTPWENDMM